MGWKGEAKPHPQLHHHIPNQVSTDHQKSTGNPQTIPLNHAVTTSPKCILWPFCHTTYTRAHLISCVGGATPSPHNNTNPTPLFLFLRPCSAPNHSAVVCLINRHGLTFDLLPCPPERSRSRTGPPVATYPLCTPKFESWTGRTRPPGSCF